MALNVPVVPWDLSARFQSKELGLLNTVGIPSDTFGFAEQALNSKLCSGNGEAERLCLGEGWRSGVYRRKKTNKKTPPQIAEENPKLNFFISCARNPRGRGKNLNS